VLDHGHLSRRLKAKIHDEIAACHRLSLAAHLLQFKAVEGGERLESLVIRAGVAFLFAYVLLSSSDPAHSQGIAASYVRDVGIQNDPDVILTEMFEDSVAAAGTRRRTAPECRCLLMFPPRAVAPTRSS